MRTRFRFNLLFKKLGKDFVLSNRNKRPFLSWPSLAWFQRLGLELLRATGQLYLYEGVVMSALVIGFGRDPCLQLGYYEKIDQLVSVKCLLDG